MIRWHEIPFAVLCPIGVGLLLTFPVSMWSRFADTVLESPITKQWVTPSYPETDGPIVHATEVNGVLETEGTVAVADIAQDRYAAFRGCMKGPGVTMETKSHCWPSAVEDGYVYWVCRSLSPVCLYWDSDGDGDVDLRDFAGL